MVANIPPGMALDGGRSESATVRRVPGQTIFVGRTPELARLRAALGHGTPDAPPAVRCAFVLGLPGVGKSALVQQFAADWRGRVVVHHVREHADSELFDELGRQFAVEKIIPDDDRVIDLAHRLDEARVLVVIENADRLSGEARAGLADLVDRLTCACVIATGRSHVFPAGSGPERLQLVLEGLDEDAARELWRWLDELYGQRSSFFDAWRASFGNPFFLRRAHAGADGADPLVSTIDSLTPAERALALAMAVADLPLPASAIGALGPESTAALAALTGKLVVEPLRPVADHDVATRAAETFVIHDLMRAALLRGASADDLAQAHRGLAAAFADPSIDPVVSICERARHLVAAGQVGAARRLLLDRATDLIRLGASGDLIRRLDELPDDVDVRLCRARVLARMLDLRRAHDDLVRLGANREHADHQLRASFAHVAMLAGDFDAAERISKAGLAAAEVDSSVRVRYLAIWAFTRTYQGHGDEAREAIRAYASRATSAIEHGYLHFYLAFSYWLEERDAEAEEQMRQAWVMLNEHVSLRARILGRTFWVTVLARNGKIDEAKAALEEVDALLSRFDDPLMRVSLMALRATLLESQGDFAAALEEVTATEHWWARGGHHMGVHWARLHRGHLLLLTGRIREGNQLLDDVERAAKRTGAVLIVRQVEVVRRADPRIAWTREPAVVHRPGEARRNHVIATLRAIATGDETSALGSLAVRLDDPSHDPLERAMLVLACALLGRRMRAEDPAPPTLEDAAALAARAGADPELITELARRIESTRAEVAKSVAIVIDRVHHVLRTGDHEIVLRSRPSLRILLYAMLSRMDQTFDKAALADALWSARYQPKRHDSALWVNMKRLRDLLAGSGLRIVSDGTGYRVVVEPGHHLKI